MKKIKRKFVFAHMKTAWVYSALSHCKRLQVGAVLVKNNNPIAIGYNGRPSGEPNVGEIDGGTHPDVQHAEKNALKKITRSNESSVGSVMFCTDSPCRNCAIDMVDAGITAVFFQRRYRDVSGIEYLKKYNVLVYFVDASIDQIFRITDKLDYVLEIEDPVIEL